MRSPWSTIAGLFLVCALVGLGRILWLSLLVARAPLQPSLAEDFAGLEQALPPGAAVLFLGDPPIDAAQESPGVRAYFRAACALAPHVLANEDQGQEFVLLVAADEARRDILASRTPGRIIARARVATLLQRTATR
ncbi:MAG: hypothetical protein JST92_08875 [Deltaproteobacteria bacterium]|nr:hypothetical protein [Deltaproteobacteria bacterium]